MKNRAIGILEFIFYGNGHKIGPIGDIGINILGYNEH
jgi:hypothetical protein